MEKVRQHIWEMFDGKSKASTYYDIIMIIVILMSLVPLVFKEETPVLQWIDHIAVTIFIINYILRWITAGLKFKKGWKSFLLYIVTPWALLDLVCILSSFQIIASVFHVLKVASLFKTLRVFRSLLLLRYMKSIRMIFNVIRDEWHAVLTVFALGFGYVLVIALIMFDMEPDTFDNFFHAIYWSTSNLTSIGLANGTSLSMLGQTLSIISTFVGIAIIALSTGIIVAGVIDEKNKTREREPENRETPIMQIEQLGELWEKGFLTEEEFNSKKTELLARL